MTRPHAPTCASRRRLRCPVPLDRQCAGSVGSLPAPHADREPVVLDCPQIGMIGSCGILSSLPTHRKYPIPRRAHKDPGTESGHDPIGARCWIEQIDGIDLIRLGEASATCLMCSGRLLRPGKTPILNPNLVAITTCSRKGASALLTSSSFVKGTVDFGGVERM
jgi:hypothetical protein